MGINITHNQDTAPGRFAKINRGMARIKLGDNRGAIADYNEAVRINPNYDKAYYNRGNAHSDLGDWQGAIGDYDRASAN